VSPDFNELVGGENATPEELAGLRRVHELLLSATPPPELSRRLALPPRIRRRPPRIPTGRMRAAFALAAAAAVGIAFGLGYSLGHGGPLLTVTRSMHGVGPLASASALIEVGKSEAGGKRELEMTVRGLPASARNTWYELYLTKRGEPNELCGRFRAGQSALTVVRLNAPDDLEEYTGWIVTARISGQQSRVLLTT